MTEPGHFNFAKSIKQIFLSLVKTSLGFLQLYKRTSLVPLSVPTRLIEAGKALVAAGLHYYESSGENSCLIIIRYSNTHFTL